MEAVDSSLTFASRFCRSLFCENIKLFVGSCAVFILLLVLFVGVSLQWCTLKLNPAGLFILLFLATLLLAYCEALHYACVSVEKLDLTQYQEKYPRACKCAKLVDNPVKLKKFLVGRQFFTIFVVFLISEITSFPGIPKAWLGLPPVLILLILQIGLPGIMWTLTIGQLISQIYVEEFTLPFMNLYGCEFVIRLSLGAEYIGICNYSWGLYYVASNIFCHKINETRKTMNTSDSETQLAVSGEDGEPLSPTQKIRGPHYVSGLERPPLNWFDYLKYGWSTIATVGSVIIICYGIATESYVLPVNPVGGFIVAIVGITILFYLEGLMIAIVGTQYWDPEVFREYYPRAYRIHKLINQPENVKRFIIGRQFCTVLTNFMLGQVFTFANFKNPGVNPIIFFIVIKSGLVGVLTVLAHGQLLPELLAAEYPLRFMNMPGSYSVCFLSLVFDAVGIGHAAWTVYYVSRRLCCGKHLEAIENVVTFADKPKTYSVYNAEVLSMSGKTQQTESGQNV